MTCSRLPPPPPPLSRRRAALLRWLLPLLLLIGPRLRPRRGGGGGAVLALALVPPRRAATAGRGSGPGVPDGGAAAATSGARRSLPFVLRAAGATGRRRRGGGIAAAAGGAGGGPALEGFAADVAEKVRLERAHRRGASARRTRKSKAKDAAAAAAAARGANATTGSAGGEAFGSPDLDALRARAGVLRAAILRQQMELQELERQIQCCSAPRLSSVGSGAGATAGGASSSRPGSGESPFAPFVDLLEDRHPLQFAAEHVGRTFATLSSSTNVLLRKLGRVHQKRGPQNQRWENVGEFVAHQSQTAGRIVKSLVVDNPERLAHLVVPETPTLVPHAPAILARLDRLEDHVAPILERVLNNRRHLASVEPYLPEILERFDDIEPHLPWILDNIDALAPYTGLLLKHIDELLLYADVDEHETSVVWEEDGTATTRRYDLAEQLLPYLEYYVSKLDVVGPHLPLLRPHVPLLLKHNRLARVSPHVDRLFARGYADLLSASANMDVLLFWFGWALRVPGLPRLFFALPWSPAVVSFLANRLPRRFVRGRCAGVTCVVEGGYGSQWNRLEKT